MGYVARILGTDPTYVFRREFLRGVDPDEWDPSTAEDGLYEVKTRKERKYYLVQGGQVKEVDFEEAKKIAEELRKPMILPNALLSGLKKLKYDEVLEDLINAYQRFLSDPKREIRNVSYLLGAHEWQIVKEVLRNVLGKDTIQKMVKKAIEEGDPQKLRKELIIPVYIHMVVLETLRDVVDIQEKYAWDLPAALAVHSDGVNLERVAEVAQKALDHLIWRINLRKEKIARIMESLKKKEEEVKE